MDEKEGRYRKVKLTAFISSNGDTKFELSIL